MQLDQQQLEIINSTESRIIVVAGAGSGKTSVLTERIRHLILDLGTRPADIVAITFTNKAADEMLSRMQDIPDIGDAFIGTIHSFANKILHAAGLYYQLLTDEMHVRLCHELISSYAKALTVERYDEFHLLVSQVKYGTVSKREVEEFFNYDEKEEYKAIYSLTPTSDPYFPETIPTICQARGIITFDDLLKYAKQYMLETNSTIKYCLVDEFQDVGNLEDRFITSLNAENYFLVGDDWQSIYKFKGANVDTRTSSPASKRTLSQCARKTVQSSSSRRGSCMNGSRSSTISGTSPTGSSLPERMLTVQNSQRLARSMRFRTLCSSKVTSPMPRPTT